MIRKQLLFLFPFLLLFCTVRGQNLKGNIGPDDSHGANASKGTPGGGLVGVDLFTGTASVNVPIYGYAVDGIDFSVSLGYTAKGIRVNELASPVGLGWILNAGGSITRQVEGLEDEVTLPTEFSGNPSGDKLQGRLVPGANVTPDTSSTRTDDMEHDLFHFDLCGRSLDVAFTYINGNLVYQTYPKSEIKIDLGTWHNSSFSSTISSNIGTDTTYELGFIVTDEAGNKFYFSKGDYQYKDFGFYPGNFTTDSGSYYATQKWNLTQVTTYSGLNVTFEYIKKYVEYTENITEELYPKDEIYIGGPTYAGISYDPVQIVEHRWKGIKTQLSKIVYPNNVTVYITSDTSRFDVKGDYKVKQVKVENKYDNTVKNTITYEFNYAYFNSPNFGSASYELPDNYYAYPGTTLTAIPSYLNADSAKKKHYEMGLRLKLKNIVRRGTDFNTTEPFYTFEYNTSVPLPYRFSAQQDFYGYYNGNTVIPHVRHNLSTGGNYNDTFYLSIPYPADPSHTYTYPNNIIINSPTTGNNLFGADRSYNFTNAQADVLTKIRNCAGGEIELQYQNYTLSNPSCSYGCIIYDLTGCRCDIDTALQGQEVNDGLCIWKVINRDSFNTQNYTYREYTLSNGIRFHRGGYCWYPDLTNGYSVYTNYFVGPHKYYNGSNHGFSTVTVEEKDLTYGNTLAKTEYTFSNLMYQDGASLKSWLNKPTGYYWHTHPADMQLYHLGLPLTATEYKNGYPVSETTNAYEDADQGWSIINYKVVQPGSIPWWPYIVVDHNIARLKTQTTSINLDDPALQISKTTSTTYTYDYDAEGNVICSQWTDSKGDSFKEYRTYTHNDPDASGLNLADVQHLLSTETWKMNGSDSSLLHLSMSTTNAVQTGPLYPQTYKYRSKAVFSTRLKQPLTSAQYHITGTGKNIDKSEAFSNSLAGDFGSKLVRDQQITRYDKSGNAVETQLEDKDIYISAIYDDQNQKLLADIQNAKFDQVGFSSFEGDYSDTTANNYTSGNFEFNPNGVTYYSTAGLSKAITGKYVYELVENGYWLEGKPLPAGKYVLSYWMYGGGSTFGELYNGATSKGALSPVQQNQVGDWYLYTATFDADSADYIKLSESGGVSNPNTYIDEVRLCPADAIMNSYTYYPLFGASSHTDESNYITYYEYDALGRQTITRDMRGNIVAKKEIVCNGQNVESTGGNGNPNQ